MRNAKIHNMVEISSFGDPKSYVQYLIETYPNLVLEGVLEDDTMMKKISSGGNRIPISLDTKDSAILLMNWTSLTQREYNNMKEVLKHHNVHLASYDNVSKYLKNLDVGDVSMKLCECNDDCMSATCDLIDTVKMFVAAEPLYSKMKMCTDLGELFSELQKRSPVLYGNLNSELPTIFLQVTGDNFRAAKKQCTEQVSVSILNVDELLNSPYGQILLSLWRGKENRKGIKMHSKNTLMTSNIWFNMDCNAPCPAEKRNGLM